MESPPLLYFYIAPFSFRQPPPGWRYSPGGGLLPGPQRRVPAGAQPLPGQIGLRTQVQGQPVHLLLLRRLKDGKVRDLLLLLRRPRLEPSTIPDRKVRFTDR